MKQYILVIVSIIMMGCTTAPITPKVDDFPANPSLVQYTNPPIIRKIDKNFEVTDELIMNSTLLTDYYKRIEKWKLDNNIR